MSAVATGRRARALLLNGEGRRLGCLPLIQLTEPWWPDTAELLALLKARYGLSAWVVRLLTASAEPFEPGAEVTYAVEVDGYLPGDLPLTDGDSVPLGDDPEFLRMPWARLGGVAADLDWADGELALYDRQRTGDASQVKSWNLSLLLRIPTSQGPVWLKHVPPFMRHEGRVIELVNDAAAGVEVPQLVAVDPDGGRVLLEEIPGVDQHEPAQLLTTMAMVASLVRLQRAMASGIDALQSAGAPDWRGPALLRATRAMAERSDVRGELAAHERVDLDRLIQELPDRLSALLACGVPDSLVHGDFHPGNHRLDGDGLVLLDWGDAGVGNPLLDMAAFLDRIPDDWVHPVRRAWLSAWVEAEPGANVSRAAELIPPIAALRQALIYRMFLDNIEPSERIYHRGDPATWLRRAIGMTAR